MEYVLDTRILSLMAEDGEGFAVRFAQRDVRLVVPMDVVRQTLAGGSEHVETRLHGLREVHRVVPLRLADLTEILKLETAGDASEQTPLLDEDFFAVAASGARALNMVATGSPAALGIQHTEQDLRRREEQFRSTSSVGNEVWWRECRDNFVLHRERVFESMFNTTGVAEDWLGHKLYASLMTMNFFSLFLSDYDPAFKNDADKRNDARIGATAAYADFLVTEDLQFRRRLAFLNSFGEGPRPLSWAEFTSV